MGFFLSPSSPHPLFLLNRQKEGTMGLFWYEFGLGFGLVWFGLVREFNHYLIFFEYVLSYNIHMHVYIYSCLCVLY